MKKERAQKVVEKHLGHCSKMISGSKGAYSFYNPRNIVVFNANVFSKSHHKLWYGDLDITIDFKKLKATASELGETIYILREHDGRSFNEDDKHKEETPDFNKAYASITPEGKFVYQIPKYVVKERGKWLYVPVVKEEPQLPKYTDEYKKKEFVPIKRPRFFKGNKKSNPLELFLGAEEFKKFEGLTELAQIYLLPPDYKKLENLMRAWFVKHACLKEGSYALHKEMSWLCMSMPGEFRDCTLGPIWSEPGKCYIRLK